MAQDYELKEVFDISKFTIVGSPTITDDGIASGFSGSNYLTQSIDFSKQFKLKFKIKTPSSVPSSVQYFLLTSTRGLVCQYSTTGVLGIKASTTAWGHDLINTTFSAQTNTEYLIEIGWTGTNYTCKINGEQIYSNSSTSQILAGGLQFGGYPSQDTSSFAGSIDLKQFSITVDGEEVFKGTKTVVAKIPPEIIGSGSSVPMDYVAALEELQNYYANLLIIQYHNKPKAIGMIKSLVRALFADMMVFKIRDGFNLVNQPYAIGKQLDCIGEWVGVNRIYDAGQPLYPWFSLIEAEQTDTDPFQGGFQDWNETIVEDGGFLGFDDLVIGANKTALADDLFLALIKMKIIKNSSTHTMGDLDRKFKEYFNDQLYLTWDGINLTYNYQNSLAAVIEVAKIKNALPIPNGMVVNYNAL